MPIQGQPHHESAGPGEVQFQLDSGQHAIPPAFQKSVLSQPDTRSALYSGGGQVPNVVTAECCAAEGIPDPRSNDSNEFQHTCDLKLQSDVQGVLPPGHTLHRSAPRERKSRSVSVSKRGSFSRTRPASFARSVSPTISKFQVGNAKEQLKSCLQTTPHKQKGNTARNKSHLHSLQVDVTKPVATPVPPDIEMSPRKPSKHSVDDDIIDLVQKISREEKEEEALMKAEINDAVHKWCSLLPAAHQTRIAYIAFKFRYRILSTICFLVAAYRLLARAPWTTNIIAVDIKQAALYAISKGWSLKAPTAGDFPFAIAELAVAAATYLEQVPPGVPDDPLYTMHVMFGFLPPECSKLFSTATLTCPHCLATCATPCPLFITHVTWVMDEWADLATTFNGAFLHPWVQSQGWHAEGCNMSDSSTELDRLSSWVLLQLQPEQHDNFPLIRDSMHLAKDRSLPHLNATVNCFLCSNSKSLQDPHKHYWVVEFESGTPRYVFDSLQGKQKLTQKLARKLRVFGVLLNVGTEQVPFLRTKELDEAAGITSTATRGRNPILVVGRGRIQWARNFLCKKHTTASSKKGRVRKHTLKSSSQKWLTEKQDRNLSTKGLPRGRQKVAGKHRPRTGKPDRGQPNVTEKTFPKLFSQTSFSQEAQGQQRNPDINTGCVFSTSLMTLLQRTFLMLTLCTKMKEPHPQIQFLNFFFLKEFLKLAMIESTEIVLLMSDHSDFKRSVKIPSFFAMWTLRSYPTSSKLGWVS